MLKAAQTVLHNEWLLSRLCLPDRAISYLQSSYDDSPEAFADAVHDVAEAFRLKTERETK